MAGRPPKVDHIRDSFIGATESAGKLYTSVLAVSGINPAIQEPRLHSEHVRRVVELAFLGVVGSWEEFLERTLVRYIAGAKCDGGYQPKLRLGKAADITHAYHLVAGDPNFDPSKDFIGLSDPRKTVNIAKLFFEGGKPYANAIKTKQDRLIDAARLRHRVAHSSEKSREDFKKTARILLNLGEGGQLTRGYRVGDLLVAPADRHFGPSAADRKLTFFQAFMEMFCALARRIVRS